VRHSELKKRNLKLVAYAPQSAVEEGWDVEVEMRIVKSVLNG